MSLTPYAREAIRRYVRVYIRNRVRIAFAAASGFALLFGFAGHAAIESIADKRFRSKLLEWSTSAVTAEVAAKRSSAVAAEASQRAEQSAAAAARARNKLSSLAPEMAGEILKDAGLRSELRDAVLQSISKITVDDQGRCIVSGDLFIDGRVVVRNNEGVEVVELSYGKDGGELIIKDRTSAVKAMVHVADGTGRFDKY